jgi:hypothetical protein
MTDDRKSCTSILHLLFIYLSVFIFLRKLKLLFLSDVCDKVNCNQNGKCKYKGLNGFACECDPGWYGETCSKEDKASLGGWIAGIVILSVLVVIVSGVAFMFARR